jgi:DNA-(apurinic or apyrimidinic site) lyase
MKVGVYTVLMSDRPLPEALGELADLGAAAVELPCGPLSGRDHLDPERVLDEPGRADQILDEVADQGLEISALATHGNPLHPDEETAANHDRHLREAIRAAETLGVDCVTCFSGLPAGGPNDEVPNWITAPWPTEHRDAHEYQWNHVAIPYWREIAEVAAEHGVDVGIEMHPNMLVYEPTGMVRLREATNQRIGANFDPSHLYWQGIDVTAAIRYLGEHDAIHHVHAKDSTVIENQARIKGVLDTAAYTEELDRSWLFRTIGYGHGEDHWKDLVSTLRMVGYDGSLSIEHEDSLTSSREGLKKAVDLLHRAVFETVPGDPYWAE